MNAATFVAPPPLPARRIPRKTHEDPIHKEKIAQERGAHLLAEAERRALEIESAARRRAAAILRTARARGREERARASLDQVVRTIAAFERHHSVCGPWIRAYVEEGLRALTGYAPQAETLCAQLRAAMAELPRSAQCRFYLDAETFATLGEDNLALFRNLPGITQVLVDERLPPGGACLVAGGTVFDLSFEAGLERLLDAFDKALEDQEAENE